MKNLQRYISLILILILTGASVVQPQSSSNIRYRMTDDNKMEIMYEVKKSGTYIVTLSISTDGGKTYAPVPQHTDGDIGRCKLIQGTAQITWDLFQDVDQLDGKFIIMIEMTEVDKKPISKWIYIAGAVVAGGLIAGLQVSEDTKKPTSTPITPDENGFIMINGTFPK